MKILFMIFTLFCGSAGFAESGALPGSDIIYSHGGGPLLEQVFEGIGKILYGESAASGIEKTFKALIKIALLIGAFSSLCLAFFRQKFEPLIRSFLLPGLVIATFLLVPRTTVSVASSSKKIEVPFILGKFAVWTSSAFHQLHQLFADSIGNPYPWIDRIHTDQNFFRLGALPISDPDLEKTFREFCHECVFRDLGTNLYNKHELGESTHIVQFLEANTSLHRSMVYNGETLSCREAMKRISPSLLEVEISDNKIDRLLGDQENLASQKIAIDYLEEQLHGRSFKSQNQTLGAIGAISLLSLRNFFEAVLYLLFPVVILLSLLSFGVRTLFHWIKMILWIGIWPIFYVAIDLFLSSIWDFRTDSLDYTFATASKFSALYGSMETLASLALLSIPVISWFLIKGSMSQLVHLATSFPTQSATETKTVAEPVENTRMGEFSDESRQTYGGHVVGEEEQNHGGFQTSVEHAKTEERSHAMQQALSSIRGAVRDSSEEISRAVKETPKSEAAPISTTIPTATDENLGQSQMHLPSHGSWRKDPS